MRYAIVTVSTLAALVAGQPMMEKRDIEWVTEVVKVTKTIDVTTTIYVDAATPAPDAYVPPVKNNRVKAGHGHKHVHQQKPKYQSPPQDNKSKDDKPKDKVNKPKDKYNKPKGKDSKPKGKDNKPKPKHNKSKPAPPPPVYTPPPPPPEYKPAPKPKAEPKPAPKPEYQPKPAAPAGGNVKVGEMTYYTPGLGSCGETSSEADDVVALAVDMMANGANPNLNPKCGQSITIEYQGRQHQAKVMDTCYACATNDIDISPPLFGSVAPSGDGRVTGVKWWFNN